MNSASTRSRACIATSHAREGTMFRSRIAITTRPWWDGTNIGIDDDLYCGLWENKPRSRNKDIFSILVPFSIKSLHNALPSLIHFSRSCLPDVSCLLDELTNDQEVGIRDWGIHGQCKTTMLIRAPYGTCIWRAGQWDMFLTCMK